MTETDTSKKGILIIILVTVLVITGLIFLGKLGGHGVNAEHFAIEQGKMMFDHMSEYKASAVVSFMEQIFSDKEMSEELEHIFTQKVENKEVPDHEFIKILENNAQVNVVIELSEKLRENYDHALSSFDSEEDMDDFKTELHLKLRSFLLDYNKERIRHGRNEEAKSH